MMVTQKELTISAKPRGFHIITREVLAQLPELRDMSAGVLHLFLQHTSASLAINENADPDVRQDLEAHFRLLAPDDASHYTHTVEGRDDMTAHIKAVMIGPSLNIPVTDGDLNLGTWQGIYLCEHRIRGGIRRIIATLMGE